MVKRYARANNEYAEVYDPETKKTYLLYLDANNLYGFCMMQVKKRILFASDFRNQNRAILDNISHYRSISKILIFSGSPNQRVSVDEFLPYAR